MSVVPDEIVETVRRAATAANAHGGDLGSVRRRAVRQRRRRQVAAATCAAALVTTGAAALPTALDRTPPEPATAVLAPPAQRLLFRPGGLTLERENGTAVGLLNEGRLAEVRPDGSLARHIIPGVDDWLHAVGLPDGRLVVLGFTDLTPEAPRSNPDAAGEGRAIELEVLAANGTIELSRDVGVKGEITRLVGADETTAYLLRPRGLVAHDLPTGTERPVLPLSAFRSMGPRVDVVDGVVAVADGCEVRVFAPPASQPRIQAVLPCPHAAEVRLSPDGLLAAVAYHDGDALRLAVVDTHTGATVTTETLYAGTTGFKDIYDIAWADDRSVRVAWAALPPDANRRYRIDEVLRTRTVTVP